MMLQRLWQGPQGVRVPGSCRPAAAPAVVLTSRQCPTISWRSTGRRYGSTIVASAERPAVGLWGGRLLLLPGINPQDGSQSAPAQPATTSNQQGDLWGGFISPVAKGGLNQLQDLVDNCGKSSADTNTLLVIYAPWCPHCRAMETEVDKLAAEMRGQVRVVAVRGDTAPTRSFVKEQLQVHSLPAILLFPAQSQTYFRYRSPQRDAISLQRFISSIAELRAGPVAPAAEPVQQVAKKVEQVAVQVQTPAEAVASTSAHAAAVPSSHGTRQAELLVNSATAAGVPMTTDLTDIKGRMVGLAAVMGIGLAVAQTVTHSSNVIQGGNGARGPAQSDLQELDGNIHNVVKLLKQLLMLKASLFWANIAQRSQILTQIPQQLQPQARAPAPAAAAAPQGESSNSDATSNSGAPQAASGAGVEAFPWQLPAAAGGAVAPTSGVARTTAQATTAADTVSSKRPTADASTAAVAAAAARRQQLAASTAAATSLATLAATTQQLQAAADWFDIPEGAPLDVLHAALPGQQQEARLTQQEVSVTTEDAAALLQQLLEAGGKGSSGGSSSGNFSTQELELLLQGILDKKGNN